LRPNRQCHAEQTPGHRFSFTELADVFAARLGDFRGLNTAASLGPSQSRGSLDIRVPHAPGMPRSPGMPIDASGLRRAGQSIQVLFRHYAKFLVEARNHARSSGGLGADLVFEAAVGGSSHWGTPASTPDPAAAC
jgi:hypothetical protein